MNSKFKHVRKGDRFFKAVWNGSLGTDYMSGRDIAEAFSNHGYGGGALGALDYWGEVYPCLNCEFIADDKATKRKHRCVKVAA